MTKRKIKIASFQFNNYMELGQSENGKVIAKGGIESKFLDTLAERLDFRYEIILAEDCQWGIKTADGNWTGIIGMVYRKEADMAVNSLDMSYERSLDVNFTYPYLPDDVTFVTTKPDVIAKAFVFAWPFGWKIWLLVGLSVVLYPLLVVLHNRLCAMGVFCKMTPGKIIFQFFGSLLGQAIRKVVPGRCGYAKLVMAPWLLFRLFLVSCYTSMILPWLMFVNHDPPVNTVTSLVRALHLGTRTLTTVNGSSYYSTLMGAETGILGELGTHLRQNPEYILDSPNDDDLEKLFSNPARKMALVYSRNIVKLNVLTGRRRQKLLLAEDSLLNQFAAAAVSRDFCCLREVNSLIHRMSASGLFEKWLEDELFFGDFESTRVRRANSSEDIEDEQAVRPLNLQDLYGVFFVLLMGYTLASISLCVDLIKHRITHSKMKNSKRIVVKELQLKSIRRKSIVYGVPIQ